MHYFVVNPNSRSGGGRKVWNLLQQELAKRKVEYQVFFTEYVGHAAALTEKITKDHTKEQPVHLVAVGGDGTIQEILTGIADLEGVILGYIPTGSGNDFCRSMGLPQDSLKALDCILKEERIGSIDVPYICQGQKRYRFGISAGMGYDAAVCQEVSASPAKKILNKVGLGKLSYLLIALKQFLFISPGKMSLEMDGNRKYKFQKVYFAAVMNQKYEGGGFRFCPDSKPSDGILDVIVIEGIPKIKLLFCLPTAFWGGHTRFHGVHIFRCRNIKLQSEQPLAVHRDGEGSGIYGEISVSLEKKALKVILPML